MNRNTVWDICGGVLAICWVSLFTAQYAAAWQLARTRLGMWAPFTPLQGLDLLTVYTILAGISALYLAAQHMRKRAPNTSS
jgi:hypothetical protein